MRLPSRSASSFLSEEQRRILLALQQGCQLKVHRSLDGAKVYQLHWVSPQGQIQTQELAAEPIRALEQCGCLQSNMKFPAASLLLTEYGTQLAAAKDVLRPVGPRSY